MADPRLLLLAPDGREKQDLLASLDSRLEFRVRNSLPKELSGCDLLWIHRGPEDPLDPPSAEDFDRIRAFVEGGGRLLLTGAPAAWTGDLGLEDRPPIVRERSWTGPVREEERLGLAPFLGHPLFERFPGGLYLRRPQRHSRMTGAWYENGERPLQGRILAVEKVHLGIDARRGLLIEHHLGEGRVLSLGAHLVFSDPPESDPFRESRLRFVGDLVDDLLSAGQESLGRAWPSPMRREAAWQVDEDRLEPFEDFAPLGLERFEREEPRMTPEPDPSSYFDLVGRRGDLLTGEAGQGPTELWHLPLRSFRDMGVRIGGRQGRLGSWSLWPLASSRRVETDSAVVQEYWTVGTQATGAACSHRLVEGASAILEVSFTCDHRLLWPYPSGALGNLSVERDESGRRMEIEDESGVGLLCIAWSRRPSSLTLEDAGGEGGVRIGLTFDLRTAEDAESAEAHDDGGPDRVEGLFVAGLDAASTRQRMRDLVSGESDLVAEILSEDRTRRRAGLRLGLGDPRLDAELDWIRSKGRDFFQVTEHLWEEEDCSGYVAGFQGTQPGWCSGRPGLAWYHGRDGVWTAAQSLIWGDRSEVAAQLRLLAGHQGPDGQILGELTPSGTLQYDALDTTPLFVTLLARYFAWTGDQVLVEELFPVVERALFGQLLPHSSRVGQRDPGQAEQSWIEDGPLREGQGSDLSLACLQAEALDRAAWMARCLGRNDLGQRLETATRRALRSLEQEFKDPETGLHASVLAADGDSLPPLTALSVLPFLHGLASSAGVALRKLASEAHAADWGHRLLDSGHPGFDPGGYQAGSVWPLVGGWVTRADFASGRSEQAWAALRGQMSLVRHFAPGVIEEAYSGDRFVPAGVCAHQAWSHAALLSSLTEGLLGLGTSADGQALVLRPSLPIALPEITFEGLQYRDLVLSGRLRRGPDGLLVSIEVGGEGKGELDLSALFPLPARSRGVRWGEEEVSSEARRLEESLLVQADRIPLEAGRDLEIAFVVETDCELEPPFLLPVPGMASTTARLLSRHCSGSGGDSLRLTVEGPEGDQSWPLRLPNRLLESIDGAEVRGEDLHFHLEASGTGYGSKEILLTFVSPT